MAIREFPGSPVVRTPCTHSLPRAQVQSQVGELRSQKPDFTGDAVVKNPPANAGDTSSSPGPGRSHILWSN